MNHLRKTYILQGLSFFTPIHCFHSTPRVKSNGSRSHEMGLKGLKGHIPGLSYVHFVYWFVSNLADRIL